MCSLLLASCNGDRNFSQFPGFAEHFNQYPPQDRTLTTLEFELIEKFKPAVYLAEGQREPVDFYTDYIARGELQINGKKISDNVTPDLLNQYRDNPEASFHYLGDYRDAGSATVYARLDIEETNYPGVESEYTFLTYNLVFPVSGILQGLGALQSVALTIGGNLNDWHQLDHYVSVMVAVVKKPSISSTVTDKTTGKVNSESGGVTDYKAVAMTLQQHNYQTTYLLDPDNPEISVDIAMRSNELYQHSSQRIEHPAVSFLSSDNMEFVLTGNNKPTMAGYDITHGQKTLSYQLSFLPQTDAFYQFKGALGKARLLPGRSGPPGADYVTLPGLMPRLVRMVTGYRPESAAKEIALYKALLDRENFSIRADAVAPYKKRFFEAL